MKLSRDFYTRPDVVLIAKQLLGKVLYTKIGGAITAGIITETEAYAGTADRASHAYNNRRTRRTEAMYSEGGTAYVYLCYGMHHLFNIVTNRRDVPHAVLVRAIRPFEGTALILARRKKKQADAKTCGGPGTVSQGLGIKTTHTGENLLGNRIWVEDKGIRISSRDTTASPRIGVDYAGADALLPYRFLIAP